MAAQAPAASVEEPFPIFTLAHKFLIYDVNVITYIRQQYNICGVLIGGLPQAPQQNVFLGMPLELMPEEARLLVEKSAAYIVDDVKAHQRSFLGNGMAAEERMAFQDALRKQGTAAAKETSKRTDERKKTALQQKLGTENWNDIPEDMLRPTGARDKKRKTGTTRDDSLLDEAENQETDTDDNEILFSTRSDLRNEKERKRQDASVTEPTPFAITPATSQPPLVFLPSDTENIVPLPIVPPSYPLYKHMHSHSYFLAPGLRFGCQYMAYPGDPLRFHSHFLCNGMGWDQEFDLLDLVGGGRLGTGVKKGFLIGGAPEMGGDIKDTSKENVRAFCIEWAGM